LRGRFGLRVDYADERLSSVEAQEKLLAAGHRARSARRHLDAVSAQLILESYFGDITMQADHNTFIELEQPDDCATDACTRTPRRRGTMHRAG
jgi:hypothetical protein